MEGTHALVNSRPGAGIIPALQLTLSCSDLRQMPALFKPAHQQFFWRSANVARIRKLVFVQRPNHYRINSYPVAAKDIRKHLVSHYRRGCGARSHRGHRLHKPLLTRFTRLANEETAQTVRYAFGPFAEHRVGENAQRHVMIYQQHQPGYGCIIHLFLMPPDKRIVQVQDYTANSPGTKVQWRDICYRLDDVVRAKNQPSRPNRMIVVLLRVRIDLPAHIRMLWFGCASRVLSPSYFARPDIALG